MPNCTDAELAADIDHHRWVVLKATGAAGLDLINDIGEAVEGGARFADGDVSGDFLEGYDVTFRALPLPPSARRTSPGPTASTATRRSRCCRWCIPTAAAGGPGTPRRPPIS